MQETASEPLPDGCGQNRTGRRREACLAVPAHRSPSFLLSRKVGALPPRSSFWTVPQGRSHQNPRNLLPEAFPHHPGPWELLRALNSRRTPFFPLWGQRTHPALCNTFPCQRARVILSAKPPTSFLQTRTLASTPLSALPSSAHHWPSVRWLTDELIHEWFPAKEGSTCDPQ